MTLRPRSRAKGKRKGGREYRASRTTKTTRANTTTYRSRGGAKRNRSQRYSRRSRRQSCLKRSTNVIAKNNRRCRNMEVKSYKEMIGRTTQTDDCCFCLCDREVTMNTRDGYDGCDQRAFPDYEGHSCRCASELCEEDESDLDEDFYTNSTIERRRIERDNGDMCRRPVPEPSDIYSAAEKEHSIQKEVEAADDLQYCVIL